MRVLTESMRQPVWIRYFTVCLYIYLSIRMQWNKWITMWPNLGPMSPVIQVLNWQHAAHASAQHQGVHDNANRLRSILQTRLQCCCLSKNQFEALSRCMRYLLILIYRDKLSMDPCRHVLDFYWSCVNLSIQHFTCSEYEWQYIILHAGTA